MDIKQIRLINLRILIDEAGSAAELARRAKTDPAYISQIQSPKIKRGLGDELARRFERAMNRPHGWMDRSHRLDEAGPEKEQGVGAISREEQVLLEKYRKLSPKERTQLQAISDALVTTKQRKDRSVS